VNCYVLKNASGSIDKTVKLWDVSTSKEIGSLGADKVSSVAFAPGGRLLAVGSENGTAELWTVEKPLASGGPK